MVKAVVGSFCATCYNGVLYIAEPVVSLDLDLVIAADQLEQVEALLQGGPFHLKRFAHSLNLSLPDSDLRIQIQTDPRYASFPERASAQNVLGLTLPVASLPDLLQGKVWAAQDADRRASKRQKDLADIARILEAYPDLRGQVPDEILERLL